MTQDWWARKMRGEVQARPAPLPPTPIRVPAAPVAPAYTPQVPGVPARQDSRCPECGSGNYMGRGGSVPRCFNCGYTQTRDFRNSTQGLIGDGPTSAAPGQVPGAGYNPQNIIGKVG